MPKYYAEHIAACLLIRWRREDCPIHYLVRKKHFIDIMKGTSDFARAYLIRMLTPDELEQMITFGYGRWIFKKYAV